MDMLHPLDNIDFPPLEHAILNMFKGALEYPAGIEAQASKIANDIVYCCSNVNSEDEIDGTFLAIWDVTFDLASYITPNHKWQQSLIRALEIIRQREGSTSPEHAVRRNNTILPFVERFLTRGHQRTLNGVIFPNSLCASENAGS